jgi:N-acetylglucosamine kinase-like BadF-type ATPase
VNYLDNPDEASEALKESLLQQFGGLSENTIVPKVYGSGTPATTLARLAKFIGQDANEERQYAIQSIDRNLGALIDVLEHHIRKNFPDQLEFEIVLSGGVWKSAQIFRERLIQLLAARFPSQIFVVNRITQPPLYGALELAKEMLA